MEKIVFIEQGMDSQQLGLKFIVELAEQKKAHVAWLLLLDPGTLSDFERKVEESVEVYKKALSAQGGHFESTMVEYTSTNFFGALDQLLPLDLIVAGRLDLGPLAEERVKELEDISTRYHCPVIPLSALMPEKRESKGRALMKTLVFGAIAAGSYFLFFPQLDKLNHLIYMKGTILGGLAVMVTVPIHAYVYGSFTEMFPKLLGLEKSAGINH